MFNTAYDFHLIDHKQFTDEKGPLSHWIYNFQSVRRRYTVLVELYSGHIYVVKYFADCHSHSKNKFSLLLNDEIPAPIIRTCVNIMLDFFRKNRYASFGFIVAHSVGKRRKGQIITEEKANTQRLSGCLNASSFNFFGQETFEHARSVGQSAYLLINRLNATRLLLICPSKRCRDKLLWRAICFS